VLILRDVLAFSAAEVAQLLDTAKPVRGSGRYFLRSCAPQRSYLIRFCRMRFASE